MTAAAFPAVSGAPPSVREAGYVRLNSEKLDCAIDGVVKDSVIPAVEQRKRFFDIGGGLPTLRGGAASNASDTLFASPQEREADMKRGSCWQRYRKGAWTIIPELTNAKVHWIGFWDLFIALCLFFTTYWVPYNIAAFSHEPHWERCIDHFLDGSFTLDLLLQFFIAVKEHRTTHAAYLWEVDPVKIAGKYCATPCSDGGHAGWFWIDVVSVFPVFCDVYRLGVYASASANDSRGMRLLKVTRVLRMLRLSRLVQLSERWHAFFGFPYFWEELMKFVCITTITCHWMACMWVMVERQVATGSLSYTGNESTWLSALILAKGDPCFPDAASDPLCVYTLAFYWATMTLTTVGYGDIVPQNMAEYLVCGLCMLAAGYIWAYVVACVVSLLGNLDQYGIKFKNNMDDLNEMMASHKVPHRFQVRLRMYMHESRHIPRMRGQIALLEENVSAGLQREFAKATMHSDLLRDVYWARDLDEESQLEIVKQLRPAFFGPREIMHMRETMVFLRRGMIFFRGRVLGPGNVWGHESILLQSPHLIDISLPFTLSFVDTLYLTKERLVDICLAFPAVDKRLRRAQVRTAMYRAICVMAYKERTGQDWHGREPRTDGHRSFGLVFQNAHYNPYSASELHHEHPAAPQSGSGSNRSASKETNGHCDKEGSNETVADIVRQLKKLTEKLEAAT